MDLGNRCYNAIDRLGSINHEPTIMTDWETLVQEAESLGYTVELVEWIECADAPGLLGMAEGAIIYHTKTIRIRERLSEYDRCRVLAHELEHAHAPEDGERIDREAARREGRTIWGLDFGQRRS